MWQRLAPLPIPNGGFGAASFGGELLVAGGTNWEGQVKNWLSDVFAYNPRSDSWRRAGVLPQPSAYAVAAALDDFWVVGGFTGVSPAPAFSLGGRTRELVTRVYSGGAVIDGRLFVLGGSPDDSFERALPDLLALDLETGTVEKISDWPHGSFALGGAASCGRRLLACGGARWSDGGIVNDDRAALFDLENGWRPLPALPESIRGIAACSLDDRFVYAAGGYGRDFSAAGYVFDCENSRLFRAADLPYAGMVGLVCMNGLVYCVAGEDRMKHRSDALYCVPVRAILDSMIQV